MDEFNSNNEYYETCDCVVFKNCTATEIIPPPPTGTGECEWSCEDFQALQIKVDGLQKKIDDLEDNIDMLIGKIQDIDAASSSGSSKCEGYKKILDYHDADIQKIYDTINTSAEDCTARALAEIRDKGLRFGDNWWFGAQGDYLFAIDIADTSYYRFNPGYNVTL